MLIKMLFVLICKRMVMQEKHFIDKIPWERKSMLPHYQIVINLHSSKIFLHLYSRKILKGIHAFNEDNLVCILHERKGQYCKKKMQ